MTQAEKNYLDLIESRKTKTDAELQQEAESHFENDIKLESFFEQLEKQK